MLRKKSVGIIGLTLAMLCTSACGIQVGNTPQGTQNATITDAAQTVNEVGEQDGQVVEQDSQVTPETPEVEPETEIAHVYITDLCDESGVYVDDCDNQYEYLYRIPHIDGVETSYTKMVNDDMDRLYTAMVEEAHEVMDAKVSLNCVSIDYSLYQDEELISICVTGRYDWEWTDYMCYTMTTSGEEVSGKELRQRMGIAEADFMEDVENTFWTMTDPTQYMEWEWYQDMEEYILEVNEKTMDPSNCNADIPVFVDTDGILCYIGRIYSMAGADFYDHIFHYGHHERDGYQPE